MITLYSAGGILHDAVTICQAAESGINLKVCSWSTSASRIAMAVFLLCQHAVKASLPDL